MPYGTDEYIVCPICRGGLQVGPGHQRAVEAMRATTIAFRAGSVADADYRARTAAFWQSMGVDPSGGVQADPPLTSGSASQASSPAQAPPVEASLADRLADLGRLHADGVLTDDEFAAAKRRLLER
jgi:hypothetical protein